MSWAEPGLRLLITTAAASGTTALVLGLVARRGAAVTRFRAGIRLFYWSTLLSCATVTLARCIPGGQEAGHPALPMLLAWVSLTVLVGLLPVYRWAIAVESKTEAGPKGSRYLAVGVGLAALLGGGAVVAPTLLPDVTALGLVFLLWSRSGQCSLPGVAIGVFTWFLLRLTIVNGAILEVVCFETTGLVPETVIGLVAAAATPLLLFQARKPAWRSVLLAVWAAAGLEATAREVHWMPHADWKMWSVGLVGRWASLGFVAGWLGLVVALVFAMGWESRNEASQGLIEP